MIFELSLKRKDFRAILRSPEILQGFHLLEVLQPDHHDAIAAFAATQNLQCLPD
jgi:hypothetical protein